MDYLNPREILQTSTGRVKRFGANVISLVGDAIDSAMDWDVEEPTQFPRGDRPAASEDDLLQGRLF